MKKHFIILLLAAGFAFNASAQKFGHGGGFYARPHVIISTGIYAPLYPFGYPFYPYPYYGNVPRSSRLGAQIEDIKNDYKDRIWSARHDKSLSHRKRKIIIHKLKNERDQAIENAKRNYYKQGYNRPY